MNPTTRCWGYLNEVDTPFYVIILGMGRKEERALREFVLRTVEQLQEGTVSTEWVDPETIEGLRSLGYLK